MESDDQQFVDFAIYSVADILNHPILFFHYDGGSEKGAFLQSKVKIIGSKILADYVGGDPFECRIYESTDQNIFGMVRRSVCPETDPLFIGREHDKFYGIVAVTEHIKDHQNIDGWIASTIAELPFSDIDWDEFEDLYSERTKQLIKENKLVPQFGDFFNECYIIANSYDLAIDKGYGKDISRLLTDTINKSNYFNHIDAIQQFTLINLAEEYLENSELLRNKVINEIDYKDPKSDLCFAELLVEKKAYKKPGELINFAFDNYSK